MAQQRQNATIRLDIMLKLVRNYHKKPPPEAGKRVKFDLATLREEPAKLEKWYRDNEDESNPNTPDQDINWEQLQKI